MGENSKIEWTDHTFNPWWGCTKVSPACDNCYAEAWAKRTGFEVWGSKGPRRFLSESHWNQPLRWDRKAKEEGVRRRVFCASMADVFELRADLNPWREKLWGLIEKTPNLDWLLLTKRPHLVERLVPWDFAWPDNVWIGATIESNTYAKKRLPHLAKLNAKVRFVSCEPLRTHLDLREYLYRGDINWVIAGGESGPGARLTDPLWFQDLRDHCNSFHVPFFFKQWGDWAPVDLPAVQGIDPSEFDSSDSVELLGRYGKNKTGRELDGREWNEFPLVDHSEVGNEKASTSA